MTNHLDKLKRIQRSFDEKYDDLTDEEKKEFTSLILTGAIQKQEANILADNLLRKIEGGKQMIKVVSYGIMGSRSSEYYEADSFELITNSVTNEVDRINILRGKEISVVLTRVGSILEINKLTESEKQAVIIERRRKELESND